MIKIYSLYKITNLLNNKNYIGNIEVTNLCLLPNRKLNVYINCNNKLASDSGNYINYKLTDGINEITSKSFYTNEEVKLYVEIDDNEWKNLVVGTYTDKLTFNWYIQ